MTRHILHAGIGALHSACLPPLRCRPAHRSRRPDAASLTPPFLDTPVAPRPAATVATIAQGKQLYDVNCVAVSRRGGQGRRLRRAVPGAAAARLHERPVQVPDDRGRPAADRRGPVPHDLARRERHRDAAVEVPAQRRGAVGAGRLREDVRRRDSPPRARSSRCRCPRRPARRADADRGQAGLR